MSQTLCRPVTITSWQLTVFSNSFTFCKLDSGKRPACPWAHLHCPGTHYIITAVQH